MVMNVKALRHHGSIITPPPPAESPTPVATVLVRYFLGATIVDTVADGSQVFPYPDGPMYYQIFTASGTNPPLLDWVFNTDSAALHGQLFADTVNLGGGLTTVSRIMMLYGSTIEPDGSGDLGRYPDTTFEAQAYEHDPIFPYSRTYGPLLRFSCQPILHNPLFDAGTGWYVNRCHGTTMFTGPVEIDSAVGVTNTYPPAWSTSDEVGRANLIILTSPNSYMWGVGGPVYRPSDSTVEITGRLTWVVTQTAGPTRGMTVSGAWLLLDTYNGTTGAPHPFQSGIIARRSQPGYNYAGTAYQLQAYLAASPFGTPINLACEV